MESCGEQQLTPIQTHQLSPELASKPSISVADDGSGQSPLSHNPVEESYSYRSCISSSTQFHGSITTIITLTMVAFKMVLGTSRRILQQRGGGGVMLGFIHVLFSCHSQCTCVLLQFIVG